jgi:Holliday junction resolvase RusA-like endonuclease
MKQFTFWSPGDPKGQPRPRAFSRNGKARVFDPGTAEGFKASVAIGARQAGLAGALLEGPVSVRLDCVFRRPKSHSTKKGLRPEAPEFHQARPDVDNVCKAVLDALSIVQAWIDDAQVCQLLATKRYGDQPGVRVTVEVAA